MLTNGHSVRKTDVQSPSPSLLLFSAYSNSSLEAQVQSYRYHLAAHPDVKLADIAFTLAHKREARPHRAYAITSDVSSIEPSATHIVQDQGAAPRIGWVFTGQGAQWPEMGVQMMDNNHTFRTTIHRLDAFLAGLPVPPPWTIEGELRKAKANSGVHRAELGHPLCVALQIALVNVLRGWGIQPDFVLGHSSGEVAAAYASGAVTAEAAMATATFRGSSHVSLSEQKKGAMAAVGLGREDVLPFLEPGVDIACENSQMSVTLSGDADGIDKVIEKLKADRPGVFARLLRVEKAYHSRKFSLLQKKAAIFC